EHRSAVGPRPQHLDVPLDELTGEVGRGRGPLGRDVRDETFEVTTVGTERVVREPSFDAQVREVARERGSESPRHLDRRGGGVGAGRRLHAHRLRGSRRASRQNGRRTSTTIATDRSVRYVIDAWKTRIARGLPSAGS